MNVRPDSPCLHERIRPCMNNLIFHSQWTVSGFFGIIDEQQTLLLQKGLDMAIIVVIFGAFILTAVIGLLFIWTRFHRFRPLRRMAKTNKALSWSLAAIPVILPLLCCMYDLINGVIVVVHLFGFMGLTNFIGSLIRRQLRKKAEAEGKEIRLPKGELYPEDSPYYEGTVAILITAIYLGIGLYADLNVWQTDYQLTTVKDLGTESLRVAQIADSHIGSTFNGDGFAASCSVVSDS